MGLCLVQISTRDSDIADVAMKRAGEICGPGLVANGLQGHERLGLHRHSVIELVAPECDEASPLMRQDNAPGVLELPPDRQAFEIEPHRVLLVAAQVCHQCEPEQAHRPGML